MPRDDFPPPRNIVISVSKLIEPRLSRRFGWKHFFCLAGSVSRRINALRRQGTRKIRDRRFGVDEGVVNVDFGRGFAGGRAGGFRVTRGEVGGCWIVDRVVGRVQVEGAGVGGAGEGNCGAVGLKGLWMVSKLGFDNVRCSVDMRVLRSGEFSCGRMIRGTLFKALSVR